MQLLVYLIVGSAANGVSLLAANSFGKAKVSDLDVAIGVHQQVFRLQVSVHNALGMEVLQGQDDIGGIEPSCLV